MNRHFPTAWFFSGTRSSWVAGKCFHAFLRLGLPVWGEHGISCYLPLSDSRRSWVAGKASHDFPRSGSPKCGETMGSSCSHPSHKPPAAHKQIPRLKSPAWGVLMGCSLHSALSQALCHWEQRGGAATSYFLHAPPTGVLGLENGWEGLSCCIPPFLHWSERGREQLLLPPASTPSQ